MASVAKRPDGRWRARYRDVGGKEHARHFDRKIDAQRWLDEVTASVVTGQYVDPKAGQVTFEEYAERWRSAQVHRPSSRAHVETMLRRHAYPRFGSRPISSVLPSDVQSWVRGLEASLAPSTIGVVHSIASSVFAAAVRDRRLVANPCTGTRLPKATRAAVVPMTTEQVHELTAAMPERLAAMVTLTAGTGIRQGECFAVAVDRLDMLRRELVVDRQIVSTSGSSPTFGPPKTRASARTIPLPRVVVDVLAAHLAQHGAGVDQLLFTRRDGKPFSRSSFGDIWRPAVEQAELPKGTRFHDLRHYYASLLIRHGESVKTVQARLGHASASETLDTYSHLWPDSDDRTREAVDAVLGQASTHQGARSAQ